LQTSHCYLGHAGSWRGLMAALQTPLDALAFDMPGHGRSPLTAPPVDFHAEVAGLMPGLLAQVAPDGRPALIIGHSFGAASALRHALDHPDSVAGLVLIEPVFFAAARDEPEYPGWAAEDALIHAAVAAGDLDRRGSRLPGAERRRHPL
jgi:lipase